MGQKIHPIGFRIGVIRDADSKWYADKEYAQFVLEDFKIRKAVKKRRGWDNAAIAKVDIERAANQVRVTLHTAKPGIIIELTYSQKRNSLPGNSFLANP